MASLSVGGAIALGLSLTYIAASICAFAFPSLLHKRRRPPQCPVKFGSHRGGAYERPENTIMAFQHALDVGSDLLELDCFLTADGQVVVVHDEHLGRLCAGAAAAATSVRSLPFAELPRVQPQPLLPPPFHPAGMRLAPYWPVGADEVANDDGTFTAPAALAAGQPMPLLDDVFRAFPHATINVDCKTPDEELVTKVIDLVRRHERQDRTIVGAFADWTGQRLRERAPDILRIFSAKESLLIYLKYFTGLLPFFALHADYLEVPLMTDVQSRRYLDAFAQKQQRSDGAGGGDTSAAAAWACSCKMLAVRFALAVMRYLTSRRWLYWHLQKRGVRVIFWVLNEPEEFAQVFDECGADGVMTDRPSALAAFFRERAANASTPQSIPSSSSSSSSLVEPPSAASADEQTSLHAGAVARAHYQSQSHSRSSPSGSPSSRLTPRARTAASTVKAAAAASQL